MPCIRALPRRIQSDDVAVQITVNAALLKLRKEKKARTLTRPGLDGVVNSDWSDAPERFATNSELGAKIKEGIAMLPEDLQAAVVLRDVEGLSYSEAVEILDVMVSSLKSRLHRARFQLRQDMDDFSKAQS